MTIKTLNAIASIDDNDVQMVKYINAKRWQLTNHSMDIYIRLHLLTLEPFSARIELNCITAAHRRSWCYQQCRTLLSRNKIGKTWQIGFNLWVVFILLIVNKHNILLAFNLLLVLSLGFYVQLKVLLNLYFVSLDWCNELLSILIRP